MKNQPKLKPAFTQSNSNLVEKLFQSAQNIPTEKIRRWNVETEIRICESSRQEKVFF